MSPARKKPTLNTQREIQREQDRRDAQQPASKGGARKKPPVQAGAREQPAELPAQHLEKPGREADMDLAPRFQAPAYRGSGKLEGMAALVTGGDSGIGRAVAVLFAREGADVAVAFHASLEDAQETQRCIQAEGRRALLLQGDVKDSAWCDAAVQRTVDAFGRLDVLVNNAAFQEHAGALEDIDDRRLQETLDTNIGGYFRMARAAVPHMKARGGGAFLNGERIRAADSAEFGPATAISIGNVKTLSRGAGWNALARLIQRCGRTRGYGDFYHYHLLARGSLDLVIESDVNILDIAALAVIVREAGGVFTDLAGREPTLETTSVLAGGPILHAEALTLGLT